MSAFMAGIISGCLIGVGLTVLTVLFVSWLPGTRPGTAKRFSMHTMTFATSILLAIGYLAFSLKLERSALLLFLLSVLAVAKIGGAKYGVAAAVIAAGLLSFLFLPPIGTLWVEAADDRLALALFLLSAIVGSALAENDKRFPESAS
jgi:K+-sensing histidine kinase KdpD